MQRTLPNDILHVWFTELTPKQHFAKDAALDESIRTRFGPTLEAAARCELFTWRATPEVRLAEILVLDQFSRNVYRDTARALRKTRWPLRWRKSWWPAGKTAACPPRSAYLPTCPTCTANLP